MAIGVWFIRLGRMLGRIAHWIDVLVQYLNTFHLLLSIILFFAVCTCSIPNCLRCSQHMWVFPLLIPNCVSCISLGTWSGQWEWTMQPSGERWSHTEGTSGQHCCRVVRAVKFPLPVQSSIPSLEWEADCAKRHIELCRCVACWFAGLQ